MIVLPRAAQRLWLTAFLDYANGNGPGPNPLLMLHLYTNDIAPGPLTNVADFVEASFHGYAAKGIAGLFPFPVTNADGLAESRSGNLIFAATDQVINETVHGWYLTLQSDVVPAVLAAAERIVPAVRMNLPAAAVCVNVRLALGSKFA